MNLINDVKVASREFISILKSSRNNCIITGAGVSTASGIPDFRGKNGIYTQSNENVFDLKSFKENPEKFYLFAKNFLNILKNSQPNSAHLLLKKLEDMGKISYIITQNIDGLHKKAGSKNLIEIHGNFKTFTCIKCGKKVQLDEIFYKIENGEVPYCFECKGVLKPDLVFFGENIDINLINKIKNIASLSEYCFIFGSSLVVHPIASIPECTLNNNGRLIIINRGATTYDEYAFIKFEVDIEKFSSEVLKNIKKKFFLFKV